MPIHRLSHGLTLAHQEWRAEPMVALQAAVRVGSLDEPISIAGVAHLLEHAVLEPDENREPRPGIDEFTGATDFLVTRYSSVFGVEQTEEILTRLVTILARAGLPSHVLEREKRVITAEMRQDHDDPEVRLWANLYACVFGTHPLARSLLGTPQSLATITRQDVLDFHARHYQPQDVVICSAGAISALQMARLVEQTLGEAWDRKEAAPRVLPPAPALHGPWMDLREEPGLRTRLHVMMCCPRLQEHHWPALALLATHLENHLGSRPGLDVDGNATGIHSLSTQLQWYMSLGWLEISAVVDPRSKENALCNIMDCLARVRNGLLGTDVLDAARNAWMMDCARSRETMRGMVHAHADELLEQSVTPWPQLLESVQSLTVSQVSEATRYCLSAQHTAVGMETRKLQGHEASMVADAMDRVERGVSHAHKRGRAIIPMPVPSVLVDLDPGWTLHTEVRRLPNGVPVVACHVPWAAGVSCCAMLPGGESLETADSLGVAALTARMMVQATAQDGVSGITEFMATRSAFLDAYAGDDLLAVYGSAPVPSLEALVEWVSQCLYQPVFLDSELDRVHRTVATEKPRQPFGMVSISNVGAACALYSGHPYAYRLSDRRQAVKGVGSAQVTQYHRLLVRGAHPTVAIAGNAPVEQMMEAVSSAVWGQIPPPVVESNMISPAPPLQTTREVRGAWLSKEAAVQVGFLGSGYSDAWTHLLQVAAAILHARLSQAVRQQGLGYAAGCMSIPRAARGCVVLHCTTAQHNVQRALEVMLREVRSLRTEPPRKDEHARAQQALVSERFKSMESTSARAWWMCHDTLFQAATGDPATYGTSITSVTPPQVTEAARRFMDPDRCGIWRCERARGG